GRGAAAAAAPTEASQQQAYRRQLAHALRQCALADRREARDKLAREPRRLGTSTKDLYQDRHQMNWEGGTEAEHIEAMKNKISLQKADVERTKKARGQRLWEKRELCNTKLEAIRREELELTQRERRLARERQEHLRLRDAVNVEDKVCFDSFPMLQDRYQLLRVTGHLPPSRTTRVFSAYDLADNRGYNVQSCADQKRANESVAWLKASRPDQLGPRRLAPAMAGLGDDGLVFEASEAVKEARTFDQMGLRDEVIRGVYAYGFDSPSAVQKRAILPILAGRDVVVQSQSGTGKTTVFCLGALQAVSVAVAEPQALLLSPTRELAEQSAKVCRALGDYVGVRLHCCVGGKNVKDGIKALKAGVHIVSGTPGRLLSMIKKACAILANPQKESDPVATVIPFLLREVEESGGDEAFWKSFVACCGVS
ncbi:unnamed protein product, partial [Prorocentrum cordatum]